MITTMIVSLLLCIAAAWLAPAVVLLLLVSKVEWERDELRGIARLILCWPLVLIDVLREDRP